MKTLDTFSKNASSSTNIGLSDDGNLTFERERVVEIFNTFFTSVASSLVNKLPRGIGTYGINWVNSLYKSVGVNENSFKLEEVEVDQVSTPVEVPLYAVCPSA